MVKRFKFEQLTEHERYAILSPSKGIMGYIKLEKGLLIACIRSASRHDFIIYSHTFKSEIDKFVDDKQREKYLTKIAERLKAIMV